MPLQEEQQVKGTGIYMLEQEVNGTKVQILDKEQNQHIVGIVNLHPHNE